MSEQHHINSDQLARYVAGEASPEEARAVETWAGSSPLNARELAAMRAAWDLSAPDPHARDVDVDAAWTKVRSRIGAWPGGAVIPIDRGRMVRWSRIAAAAAAISGIILAAWWLIVPRPQEFATTGSSTTVFLADSSRVVMGPNTHLRASIGAERHIALHGQAYFEVTPDAQRPFVVEAHGLKVTVLGTAFTVEAYDSSSVVLARVRHGKVRVAASDGQQLDLLAGDHVRFDATTRRLERIAAPGMERWGDRILVFKGTPLPEVMDQIGSVYGVKVYSSSKDPQGCKLTATFEDEPIDHVLRIVAETFGLTVTATAPGEYLLSGDGC